MKRPKSKVIRRPFTQEMRSALIAEKRRTNTGSIALLKLMKDPPDGLNYAIIESWFSGQAKTIDPALFEAVILAYRALPAGRANTRRPVKGATSRIPLTDDMRARIQQIWAVLPPTALRGDDVPEGLTGVAICHLIGAGHPDGRRDRSIRRDWWDYLLSIAPADRQQSRFKFRGPVQRRKGSAPFQDLLHITLNPPPERKPLVLSPSYNRPTHIPITDELYHQLHAEIARTRVSPKSLLSSREDCPPGLTHQLIQNWLSGRARSAELPYIDYITSHYDLLPDAPQS